MVINIFRNHGIYMVLEYQSHVTFLEKEKKRKMKKEKKKRKMRKITNGFFFKKSGLNFTFFNKTSIIVLSTLICKAHMADK